ncbi:MAG: hypothetical protein Kow0022_06360 [Phycisphaerales bacterium]
MNARLLAAALMALLASLSPRATAQDETPAELRNEISTLREQIAVLEDERAKLVEQLESLKAENAELASRLESALKHNRQLEAQLAARPTQAEPSSPAQPDLSPTPAPQQPTQAPIPTDPLGSPESLCRALIEAYARAFPVAPASTDSARTDYRRRLQQWIGSITQAYQGQTKWRMVISEIRPRGRDRDAEARFQVIDPNTGLPIGRSFLGVIPARMFLKIDNPDVAQLWDVTLNVTPRLEINPQRLTPGAFNYPPFIGPMVEFHFDMDWVGMRRVTQPDAPTPDRPQPQGTPRP